MEKANYYALKDISVKTGTLSNFTNTLEQKLNTELEDIFNEPSDVFISASDFQLQGINAREWMIDNYNSLKGSIQMVNLFLSDINDKLDKLELQVSLALDSDE